MLNDESWLLLDEIKTYFVQGTILHEYAERFVSMAAASIPPSRDCWLELCRQILKEVEGEDTSLASYPAGIAMAMLVEKNKLARTWLSKAKKLRAL